MKSILTVVIVSIILLYSSGTNGYKYIKFEQYQINPTDPSNCKGGLISGSYQYTGLCFGYTRTICNEDGTVEMINYTDLECKGSIESTELVPIHTCTESNIVSCVESVNKVPPNSLIQVTTENVCQDDPNWKHQIKVLEYLLLDICQARPFPFDSTMFVCNSTTPPVSYIFNSTNSCNQDDITGYKLFPIPTCSKENPTFSYCE